MKEDSNKRKQDFVNGLMDHYNKHSPDVSKKIQGDLNVDKESSRVPTIVSKRDWVVRSYGFLLVMFVLVLCFSHQKVLNLNYGVTLGKFNNEYSGFNYSVEGKKYSKFIEIGQNSSNYNYNSRKKTRNGGTPFRYQFINYKKANPVQVYFMLGGISNGRQDYTILSNWLILCLICLIISNYFFIKFAYRVGWEKAQNDKL